MRVQCREGRVDYVRACTRHKAVVGLAGGAGAVELVVSTPWIIKTGDSVCFIGEQDSGSGKLLARGYVNKTRRVWGTPSNSAALFVFLPSVWVCALLSVAGVFTKAWLVLIPMAIVAFGCAWAMFAILSKLRRVRRQVREMADQICDQPRLT